MCSRCGSSTHRTEDHPVKDPQVGGMYLVEFTDCCVQGAFTSKLIAVEFDGDGDPDAYVFEGGRADSLWGGWTFTEVVAAPDVSNNTHPASADMTTQ